MGIVHHGNYFVWMEIGRVELCRAAGVNYKELEAEQGILLAVSEANCRFLFPARFDEEVVITTRIAHAHPRKVTFEYEMTSASDGRRLATGSTGHVFLNREMRPVKLPEQWRPLFGIIDTPRSSG